MPFAKSRGGGGSSSSRLSDDEKLNKQIQNAQVRAADSGFQADPDKRNWFEKLTNLPKGQNGFLDTLEILSRPGQAVLNVIDKAPVGDRSVGDAAWRGFSGKDRVRGSEIVEKRGLGDGLSKVVLGTGLEVFTDPLNLVPVGALAKGVKEGVTRAGGFAKAAYDVAENALPKLKTLRENKVQPALESAKDTVGYMFNRDYRIKDTLDGKESPFLQNLERGTEASRKYLQEENARRLAESAKAAGGVESGADVGRILESPLRQFEDVKGYEFPDGLRRTENKLDLQDMVNTNRELLKTTGQGIRSTGRDFDRSISATATELQKTDNRIRRLYFSRENESLRQLTKRKNQPVNIDELAQSKAFNKVSASPAFNYLLQHRDELKTNLDALRTEATQAKSGGIEQVQKITDDNAALKESIRNPVMIQKELDRPARELSQDTNVQHAAKQLVSQNKEIVELARQNGINVPELEGHMYHILSQEERAFKKANKVRGFASNGPSQRLLDERKYKGSAEDINDKTVDKTGRRKFEENAFFAQGIGQQRLIDYIHAVSFRRQVLSNAEFAKPFKAGMKVPPNAEIIDMNNYKFLKAEGDSLEQVGLADEVGGQYLVTKAAKQLLDNYKAINTDEGTKAFIKAYDNVQSFWKRLTLFSPGYHIRNLAGAMFNNSIAGMGVFNGDLAKYTASAGKEVADFMKGKESQLFNEYRKQGLSSSGLSKVEFARAGEDPEEAIRKNIDRISKQGLEKAKSKVLHPFQTSQELGDTMDQVNRFALYKWARDKKGMTAEEASAKVKEVQFDYSRLTPFERNVMARVVPFYRWMRNNVPYQLKSFINDPRKYSNFNKLRLNAQDAVGIDDENVPDYMKESFAIPLYGEEGKGRMLGLNLPLSDLTKLTDPLKLTVDGLTPLIKSPIELSTNFNMFSRKPIERFDGQTKQYKLGPLEGQIPIKTAYALEQGLGQIGRGFSGYLQKSEDKDQDALFRVPTLGASSIAKPFDAKEAARLKKLQELKQLQDYLLYIEQQKGAKPRTVAEIQKATR